MKTALASAGGVVLIAVALRDVFDALFHQRGGKTLPSGSVMRSIWWVARVVGHRRAMSLAGPLALIAVVVSWAMLLVLGWALVYWPHMPGDFSFQPPSAAKDASLVDALYLSLTTLSTLGFGDVSPSTGWLQLLNPLEALLGFGLLTASISWLLSAQPALARRRSLAYELTLLRDAEQETEVGPIAVDSETAELIYVDLISRLVAVERDMVMFPLGYYFSDIDERFALPAVMPYLLELAERGMADERPDNVRLRATMLEDAIEDFATTIADAFHKEPHESVRRTLARYADDHLHESEEVRAAEKVA